MKLLTHGKICSISNDVSNKTIEVVLVKVKILSIKNKGGLKSPSLFLSYNNYSPRTTKTSSAASTTLIT